MPKGKKYEKKKDGSIWEDVKGGKRKRRHKGKKDVSVPERKKGRTGIDALYDDEDEGISKPKSINGVP